MVSAPPPPVMRSGPAPPSRARAGTTAAARMAASTIDRTLDRRIVGSSAIAPPRAQPRPPDVQVGGRAAAAADEHRRAGERDAHHGARGHRLAARGRDQVERQAADGLPGGEREDQPQDAQARDEHRHRGGDRRADEARPCTPAAAPTTRAAATRPVAMAATTSSARKPTAKLTVPAKSGSPVSRARWPLAACCSALAAPATTAKSEQPDVQVRAGAERRGDDRGDRQRHARDAARGDALVPGRAQPGAVGDQAARRLPADERDAQQRHPDLRRADRPGGDEHRAAQAAEQVPEPHAATASAARAGWRRRPR